jgi:ribosome maturation factor RimP
MARTTARIEELLNQQCGNTDELIVVIKKLPKARIQVFIDSDSELTIEKCAEISRFLEFHLENEGLVPEHYNLEVSSPGVDNPLQMRRQYQKNVGRKVRVKTMDGKHKSGVLKSVTGQYITLEEERKKGKKEKSKEERTHQFEFDEIESTKVLISFK